MIPVFMSNFSFKESIKTTITRRGRRRKKGTGEKEEEEEREEGRRGRE